MKNWIYTIIIFLGMALPVTAQSDQEKSFEIKISTDTILLGNTFEVRFTASNIKGNFEAPDFKDFDIQSGPNQASNMSILNGVSSQTISYSYFLRPRKIGSFFIEPAYFINETDSYETPPLEIICMPNPDGINQISRIEDNGFGINFGIPRPVKKKKLKVTKI